MVNYITDDHWKVFIPQGIQDEIQSKENIEEAIDLFWNDVSTGSNVSNLSKFANFVQFCEKGRNFSYDNLTHTWIDHTQIGVTLTKIGCSSDTVDCLKIKEFMSEKKTHEVSR